MLLIDALFRFSAVGLLLLMTFVAVRDLARSTSVYLLLLTNVCLLCFLLGQMPAGFQLPLPWRVPLRLTDTLLVPVTWLFVLSLFEKDFMLRRWHLGVAGVVVGAMLAERAVWLGWLTGLPAWWPLLIVVSTLWLAGHMLYTTLTGRQDDLLEARRRSRLYLVYLIAFSIVLAVVLGSVWLSRHQTTVNAISLWFPIVAMGLWLFQATPTALRFYRAEAPSETLSHRDAELVRALNNAMQEDHIYLDESLTVAKLAAALGVAEHRLRALINHQLGFSNFSTYVNSVRVSAVMQALAQPENADVPVLTIAYQHGFNSLPPFNRAFKKLTGVTPTEYRKNIAISKN